MLILELKGLGNGIVDVPHVTKGNQSQLFIFASSCQCVKQQMSKHLVFTPPKIQVTQRNVAKQHQADVPHVTKGNQSQLFIFASSCQCVKQQMSKHLVFTPPKIQVT